MRRYLLGIVACFLSTTLLATPKQHELGGYETWLATNRLEPKASEKMLDALLEMAAEVRSTAAK